MFFFPVSECSHGILMPADTWQLSYASKTADKPLDSSSSDTSSGNPSFPTCYPVRFLLSSSCSFKSIVQVLSPSPLVYLLELQRFFNPSYFCYGPLEPALRLPNTLSSFKSRLSFPSWVGQSLGRQ